jgi:hypothetical protein
MLKHEVIVADEWQDNGAQKLTTVSQCLQIPINKMQLCSLAVAYACSYHNPTTTWGTPFAIFTSANRSPTQHLARGMRL